MEKKNSKMGIASFLLSLMEWTCLITWQYLAILTGHFVYDTMKSAHGVLPAYVIAILVFAFLLMPVSLALGIADLCQKNRKRIFAILGILLNVPVLGLFSSYLYILAYNYFR